MPHRSTARRRVVLLLAPLVAAGVVTVAPASAAPAPAPAPAPAAAAAPSVVEIRSLSGRGDLLTGGDVLLEVALPAGTPPRASASTSAGATSPARSGPARAR